MAPFTPGSAEWGADPLRRCPGREPVAPRRFRIPALRSPLPAPRTCSDAAARSRPRRPAAPACPALERARAPSGAIAGHDRAERGEVIADGQGGAAFDSSGAGDDQFPGRDVRPAGVGIAAAAQDENRGRVVDRERIAGAGENALIRARRRTAVNKACIDRGARTIGNERAAGNLDRARGERGASSDFQHTRRLRDDARAIFHVHQARAAQVDLSGVRQERTGDDELVAHAALQQARRPHGEIAEVIDGRIADVSAVVRESTRPCRRGRRDLDVAVVGHGAGKNRRVVGNADRPAGGVRDRAVDGRDGARQIDCAVVRQSSGAEDAVAGDLSAVAQGIGIVVENAARKVDRAVVGGEAR